MLVGIRINQINPAHVKEQVILGLSRYGGLRTPTETLSLRWAGSVVLVLNKMVLVIDAIDSNTSRSRKIPVDMRNGTAAFRSRLELFLSGTEATGQ